MSKFVHYALVWIMIGVAIKLLIPQCGVVEPITSSFWDYSNSTAANSSLGVLPILDSSVTSLAGYIGLVVLVWNAFQFILDVLLMPVGLINYMAAQGAPAEVMTLVAVPYVALIILSVVDWVRSGM